MGKPYSVDLRERVVRAVEQEGQSRRQAAARFGVSYSAAIDWVRRHRETGSLKPGQMGGHKPKKISGEHRDWLVQRCREKDFTLRGLVAELGERGLKVDYRSVWEFVHAEKLTHKKDADRQRAGSSRCGASARAVDALSGPHRPLPPRLHRWLSAGGDQRDQDQHGALAGLGAARSAAQGQGAAPPLEDHDLPRRFARGSRRRALAHRRADQRRKLPSLC
jgi:putative transposase